MSNTTTIADIKTAGYIWFAWFMQYLSIPQEQLTILAMVMIIDVISGIAKQYTISPRDISSRALSLGIVKKLVLFIVLISIALGIKWVGLDANTYISTILSVLILSEVYSTIQNTYTIRTGKHLTEYDVISVLLKLIWSKIEQLLLNLTKIK